MRGDEISDSSAIDVKNKITYPNQHWNPHAGKPAGLQILQLPPDSAMQG
jgi:hypothetical protein